MKPAIPQDELQRIQALHALGILDTPPEERFDRLTRLVATLLNVPIALISLVDSERQWFKSKVGLAVEETSRDVSFCAHAIHFDDLFVVNNAEQDKRFADNPLVRQEPRIRFYAGQPLHASDGSRVGTLCAIDSKPRELKPHEHQALQDLAAIAETELRLADIQALQKEIGKQKQLQEAKEAELNQFFHLSIDLFCILDRNGNFVRLNPAFENTLGWSTHELAHESFFRHVHPEDRDSTAHHIHELSQKETTLCFENRYQHKDGSYRWILWSFRPLPKTHKLYAVARDVTDNKRQMMELSYAKEVAEQASQTKSEFLANMSHELRTPLNSVIGFSNLLMVNQDGHLSDTELSYLDRILNNGKHLLELINQILDLSKVEAGHSEVCLQPVNVCGLINELFQLFEPQISGRPIELVLDSPLPRIEIHSDRSKLKQILTNLIGNAIKFTDQGRITVHLELQPHTDSLHHISVSDTGIGIPTSHLQTIFQAFSQVDSGANRKHGGTGLGLAISRSLCQTLGYHLTATSQLHQGSTFTIHTTPPLSPYFSSKDHNGEQS
ncbi:MAG: PAS domain S-box protein [Deltaproteobacteria bacterium]|nr:MAG: PAS domain S-box protein [Deltaproteobacteria bacterium]